MTEEGRRHSPKNAVTSSKVLFLSLPECSLSALSVDDLMVSGKDISSGDVFKHSASLEQEATVRHLHGNLLHVAEPDEEAWVAALAMDGQEVQVVVETCEGCAHIIPLEV